MTVEEMKKLIEAKIDNINFKITKEREKQSKLKEDSYKYAASISREARLLLNKKHCLLTLRSYEIEPIISQEIKNMIKGSLILENVPRMQI